MVKDKVLFRKKVSEELAEALAYVDQTELDGMIDLLVHSKRIFITAAGASLLSMRFLAMMLMQSGFTAYVVGDVTTPSFQEGDALIAASYSGKTITTMQYVQQAYARNGRIGLFTASPTSQMAELAHSIVVIHHASDTNNGRTSVSYDGDGFALTLIPLFHCVVRIAGEQLGATEATMIYNHANIE